MGKYRSELSAEVKGEWHSDFVKKGEMTWGLKKEETTASVGTAPPVPTEVEEERLRQKAVMTKKHKRIYEKIEATRQRKADKIERLHKSGQQIWLEIFVAAFDAHRFLDKMRARTVVGSKGLL